MNLYGYVGNNPVNWIDLLGLAVYPDDFVGPLPLGSVRESDDIAFIQQVEGRGVSDLSGDFFDVATLGVDLFARNAIKNAALNNCAKNGPVQRILTGNRVGSGLKADAGHRAASFITKEQLKAGQSFIIKGNDGVERTLLQTTGNMNGKSGIYEYIIEPSGEISHQRFKAGGIINGVPN
jgi:uncharacterized protein RhaS with RHS repeats